MRITRVYTGVGDRGNTRLVGGGEVAKDHPRIEAYGTVDELNAVLGMLRVHNRDAGGATAEVIDARLQTVQNDLFNVGSDLATPPDKRWPGMYRVGDADITQLEGWIDDWNEQLEPLREFILPGGGLTGSTAHLARTVCRRAERRVRTLIDAEPEAGTGVLVYLNRLSDFLFVLGRFAAKAQNEPETFWQKP